MESEKDTKMCSILELDDFNSVLNFYIALSSELESIIDSGTLTPLEVHDLILRYYSKLIETIFDQAVGHQTS